MEEEREGKLVNVPKQNLELPSSEVEEVRMEMQPSPNAMEGTPSMMEEDLLRSSGEVTEGGPKSPTMDKSTWENQKREKKEAKEESEENEEEERREAGQQEEKLVQGSSTQQGKSGQVELCKAASATSVTKQDAAAKPESGARILQEGSQVSHSSGEQASSSMAPSKFRSSMARRARREDKRKAKERSFVLPTAPVRGVGKPRGSQGPSGSQPTTHKAKRGGGKKKTNPPGRQRKRAKAAQSTQASAGAKPHVLPCYGRVLERRPSRGQVWGRNWLVIALLAKEKLRSLLFLTERIGK